MHQLYNLLISHNMDNAEELVPSVSGLCETFVAPRRNKKARKLKPNNELSAQETDLDDYTRMTDLHQADHFDLAGFDPHGTMHTVDNEF